MPASTDAVQRILLDLGGRSDTRVFRNNTGSLYSPASRRWITFGLCPGASDIIGLHTRECPRCGFGPLGLFTAVEVKTGRARLTKDQRIFLETVRRRGGLAGVAHDESEARAVLTQMDLERGW